MFFSFAFQGSARAAGMNIIRDIEIESTLKEWIEPILTAAQIDPKSVNLILVQSDDINAFVAGGMNIFVYTGLLEASENPGEVIGVLAHETGHIAGGHLIGNQAALRRASYQSILGTVLGIGAAIVAGDGRLATAVMAGSQSVAAQNYLSHSRVNESSADQAALRFMESAKMNPAGLESFFEKLQDQELLPASQQNEYVRTHPLTSNRIAAIEEKAEQSPYIGKAWPAAWDEQHKRMKAKLAGFLHPDHIAWTYRDTDRSFAADYARAIAAYKQNRVEESLQRTDGLLAQEPENPYLYELKAQILVDFNRVGDALPALRKTVALRPDAGLFHGELGHVLMETAHGNKKVNEEAIKHLRLALVGEPRSTRMRRLLATAYGRIGNESMANLNLAEEAVLQKRYGDAQRLATLAKEAAQDNNEATRAADDLLAYLETVDKPKR